VIHILRSSAVLLLAIAAACAQPTQPSWPTTPAALPTGVIKGYGISPQGFPADYSRFPEFLVEVGELPNSGIMFNGAWREDVAGGSDAGEIPQTAITIVEQASVFSYTPIIVFGWRSDDGSLHISVPSNAVDDWSNEDAKTLFEQMLTEFAGTYHPPYLFLGNESDAYFTGNPDDYARWVEFYNRAYDAIKAVSPETMVGPIFQYERISGQGTFNQWTTPRWGALTAHDLSKIDIVGITVYPWISVATPEEIPDNYFAPLLEQAGDKPVAITETGWPGADLGLETAWETSPEAQLRYIDALDRILGGVNLKILNWLHYNQMAQPEGDQVFWQAYSSISLKDTEGNPRLFYDAWVSFQP
jgi:hypothetical protein